MLIKIANAPYFEGGEKNSYTIFDNVDSIEYCRTSPTEINNNDELRTCTRTKSVFPLLQPDVFISIYNTDRIDEFLGIENGVSGRPLEILSENKVYRVNVIRFTKGGKLYHIGFDTIAYICNNEGKTLEKCFAGGVLNKDIRVVGVGGKIDINRNIG